MSTVSPIPVSPIPRGFHTVTPYLVVSNARAAIDFYQRAFGARELHRSTCEHTSRIVNAKLELGDSMVLLNDEFPERGCVAPRDDTPVTVTIHLYVPNTDELYSRACKAGAKSVLAPADTFWGDRFAQVRDPFGHMWSIATHTKNVSEAEIRKSLRRAFP